jgi:DNA-binding HxlR family transcriptional regulator
MARDRFADIHCSVARAAGVVADPWTLLILRDLYLGLHRYEELRQDLGIATNVLADRLDRLADHGLIESHAYQQNPVRHDYRLTAAGVDLYGVVLALMAWGDRHLAPSGPPLRVVHHDCGKRTHAAVTCAHCGASLTPDTTDLIGGPGGALAPGTAVIAARLAAQPAPTGRTTGRMRSPR